MQLPYHIVQTDDLAYKFITQSGVVYTAYFIDISEAFGADHVYTFSFDAVGKPVNDGRVRYTIVKIRLLLFVRLVIKRRMLVFDYLKSGIVKQVSMTLRKLMHLWIMQTIIFAPLFCFSKNILVTKRSRVYMTSG